MSLTDLFTILLASIILIYAYFKLKYRHWKNRNVPYIEPVIPFGSFETSFKKTKGLCECINNSYDLAKKKGWKYFGIFIKDRPLLIPVDLELVKNITTKDFNHFTEKGIYYNEKTQPISAHLFVIGGHKWKNLRQKLTPTFTTGKMKMMFQTLVDCGLKLEENLEEIRQQKDGIDIKNIIGCFSTDIIGSVAFGLECNTLKKPNSSFRYFSNKIFERRRVNPFKTNLAGSFPALARLLGIVVYPVEVEKFFNHIVRKTVTYRQVNNVRRKDFLQLLIDIKKDTNDNQEEDDGIHITMDEIVAQSASFFVAGHETSSTASMFALYELAVNQDIQDKLREEIRTVLKRHNGEINYDSLNEMEYLQQVTDEALRMYPPIPLLTRMCVKDYKFPGTDLVIEKGTRVLIPVKGIHYDEEIYPNPEVFDPDRWTPEKKSARNQYAHIPFGEGPRICIGKRFGKMQTKIGIASIIKNHRVTLHEKTQLPLKLRFTFMPQVVGGVWLNIDKIE